MPFELFLALRYLRAGRRSTARVTALVAVVGIACGVAALIVALALADGFRDELRARILRGTAHITLTTADGAPVRDWRGLVARLRQVSGVADAAPTSYTGALLSGPEGTAYAVLRGVEPSSQKAINEIRGTITSGTVEGLLGARPESEGDGRAGKRAGEEGPIEAVMGAELAARTGLTRVGDEGWIVTGERTPGALTGERGPAPPHFAPRARRVRVSGLFRSGLYEYDSTWAYVPLADAATFEGAPADAAPVISVETTDIYEVGQTAKRVREAAGAGLKAVDWQEANAALFAALALERRTVGAIIALIVIVAALNITTTLVLLVVERRADIAVLNALGARPRSIMFVFLLEGTIIGAVGALTGVAVGLLACYVGDRCGLVQLPPDVYSLSSVPLRPRAGDAALSAALAFAVSVLATLYPARAAARLRPAEALRYE